MGVVPRAKEDSGAQRDQVVGVTLVASHFRSTPFLVPRRSVSQLRCPFFPEKEVRYQGPGDSHSYPVRATAV